MRGNPPLVTGYANTTSMLYNIPRACLLNRSPVLAMDLKAIDQACDVTCQKLVVGSEDYVANIQTVSRDMIKLQLSQHFCRVT